MTRIQGSTSARQAGNSSTPYRGVGPDTARPGARPETARAHQIFRHARPSQFPANTRKHRVTRERDSRTMRALSHFDQGAGAWPKLENVLRELRAIEARRDPGERMDWSRATLKRSIARLESSRILQRHGIRRLPGGQWGSRKRTLHPEKLLSLECEPRSKPQCEPLRFKVFELQGSNTKPDKPDTARPETGRAALCSPVSTSEQETTKSKPPEKTPVEATANPTPETPHTEATERTLQQTFLAAFRVLAYQSGDPITAAALVMWIAYRALASEKHRAPESIRYYTRAALEFEYQRPDYQRDAILEEAETRFLKVWPGAAKLIEANMRVKSTRQRSGRMRESSPKPRRHRRTAHPCHVCKRRRKRPQRKLASAHSTRRDRSPAISAASH